MIQRDSRTRFTNDGDGRTRWNGPSSLREEGLTLGELLKRLSGDMGDLVGKELELAKAELKESASIAAKSSAKLGTALVMALVGAIAVTAAIVIGIGAATGNYVLPALIAGLVELAIGATMARAAMSTMKGGEMKPAETMDTLRENKRWAAHEARDLKRDITSGKPTANAGR